MEGNIIEFIQEYFINFYYMYIFIYLNSVFNIQYLSHNFILRL